MSTDRLKIYNGALLVCADTRLASLTENRESRLLLDEVWNDGGVRYCLEQAQWHFAMRASQFDYDPSFTAQFGYNRSFPKPDDWVATSGVFSDEFMTAPVISYADEVMAWFADHDTLYIKYVSDDAAYGNNLAHWPASFTEYVKAYFASRIIRFLPGGADRVADICDPRKGVLHKALLIAKNKAAMTQPTTFPARGSWARARHSGTVNIRNDRGNPNSLIG